MHFQIPAVPHTTNPALQQQLQTLRAQKTKPVGALGQLELLALQLGLALGTTAPRLV